jgi:hypothetical protein
MVYHCLSYPNSLLCNMKKIYIKKIEQTTMQSVLICFLLFLGRCEQCDGIRKHIQIVSVGGYTLVSNINHGNRPNRIYIVCVNTTRGSSIGGGAAFVNAEDLRLTIFSVAIIRAC